MGTKLSCHSVLSVGEVPRVPVGVVGDFGDNRSDKKSEMEQWCRSASQGVGFQALFCGTEAQQILQLAFSGCYCYTTVCMYFISPGSSHR